MRMKVINTVIKNVLKVFWIFPIKKNKIFLMSFDGTSYGYDSKALVEYIERYELGRWKLIWGINDEKNFSELIIDDLSFVKIKSFLGFFHMITAGTLFYNINPPSYIPFRKEQLLINTWHSISYKKVGRYIGEKNKEQVNLTTHYLSHSEKFTEWVLRDSFLYHGEVVPSGVPRNDIFFNTIQVTVCREVRQKLGVKDGVKILLYAPTFRKNFEYEDSGLDFVNLHKVLRERFGSDWIIMYKLHPMIASKYKIECKEAIDVSMYQDMQELLCAIDIFISDYSGGMWDFALSKKPVFIFAPDVDEYDKSRGLYMDCADLPFSVAKNNWELTRNIMAFDEERYNCKLTDYFDFMGNYEKGVASKTVMELIHKTHKV